MPYPNQIIRRCRALIGLRSRSPRPDFLGIGTQKGGTTSLYLVLKQHPEVFLPDNKELHYFTKYYCNGREWYANHFKQASPGLLRGEITPYYLFHEATPERIFRLRRDMRLIALLRDPVERSLSQYFHSRRLGLEPLEIEDAFNIEVDRLSGSLPIIKSSCGTHFSHQEHSYLARSRYDEQLTRYFKLFKRKNILVLRSEDLFYKQHQTLRHISSFLRIGNFPDSVNVPRANSGEGESASAPSNVRARLAKELQGTYDWLDKNLSISWNN